MKHIGDSFQYGAAGPDSLDSPGLVFYCYKQVGISIPRSVSAMMQLPSVLEPQIEDIVIANNVSVAGIYIGGGQMVAAVTNGRPVAITPVQRVIKFVRPVY